MTEKLTGKLTSVGTVKGKLSTNKSLSGKLNYTVIDATVYDYNVLDEATLPQINNIMLKGNKTSSELNVQDKMNEISDQDIDEMIFG